MKRLFALLITLSVLGVGITLGLTLYSMATLEFDKQLDQQVNLVHKQVRERFRIFDALIANDEREIQAHAHQVLREITQTIMQSEKDPAQWDSQQLATLAKQHNVDAIYVIDPDTRVVATNFLPDLNFELGTITDSFKQYLLNLYGSGRLEVDRINVSSQTGIIQIYAYYAPVDSKYIFEVSYDVKKYLTRNRSPRYVEFMFGEFFTEMTKTNPLLEQVDIYLVNNHAAFPFLTNTQPLEKSELPVIPEGEIIEQKQDKHLDYFTRADLKRSKLHSADYLVIRSGFDLSPVYLVLHKLIAIGVMIILAVLVASYFLLTFIFDRWILCRVDQINLALEKSAEGDYSVILPNEKGDELNLISQHINMMNRRLIEREKQLDEAKQTLEQRVIERTQDLSLEVEARRDAEKKLIQLATTDPLTGTLNRRAFDEFSLTEINRAIRHNRPITLIILDLDHFKQVNDSFGHQCGDYVLIELAKLITPSLRSSDALCRHGGEEFLILLPETCETEAMLLADRLRTDIEEAVLSSEGTQLQITASFGIAVWQHHEQNIQAAINRADKALYQAKDEGRNRVVLYQPDIQPTTRLQ